MLNWSGWHDFYGRKINKTTCGEYFVEEFSDGSIEATYRKGGWRSLIKSKDKAEVFEAIKKHYRKEYDL